MHSGTVLNIDAKERQIQFQMFAHAPQRPSASPDHHQVGFVIQQGANVVSEAFDGVFFTDSLDLLFCALHVAGRRWRPGLTVHPDFPFALSVHCFIQIHDLRDGCSQIPQCEGEGNFSRRFWSGCKAARVHFHATWHPDDGDFLGLFSSLFESVDDVSRGAVSPSIEDGINPVCDEIVDQPCRVCWCGGLWCGADAADAKRRR